MCPPSTWKIKILRWVLSASLRVGMGGKMLRRVISFSMRKGKGCGRGWKGDGDSGGKPSFS